MPVSLVESCATFLKEAIVNDAEFLASCDMVDYSLLVGFDEGSGELLMGIIDYSRKYTWDKFLETVSFVCSFILLSWLDLLLA